MAKPLIAHVSVGNCIVELRQRGNPYTRVEADGYITIAQPASCEDGVYQPASSVSMYVTDQVTYDANKPLDDLINALIEFRIQLAKVGRLKDLQGEHAKLQIGRHEFVVNLR